MPIKNYAGKKKVSTDKNECKKPTMEPYSGARTF